MFTQATSENRIDERPMLTRFTRTFTPINGTNDAFFTYTRIRTGSWKHVGMTKDGAILAAKKYNILFNRLIPAKWNLYNHVWTPYTAEIATKNDKFTYVQAAIATVQHEGDGRYSVNVELDEQLESRYTPVNNAGWSAFETDPDVATDRFTANWGVGVDFYYEITYTQGA